MKNCTFCKGTTKDGFSTFTVDLENCVIVIRNVPSQICEQCGETYSSTEVMQQLFRIAQDVRHNMTEIIIVNYQTAA